MMIVEASGLPIFRKALLLPQSLDRIDARRAKSRQRGGREPGCDEREDHRAEDPWIAQRLLEHPRRKRRGREDRDAEADTDSKDHQSRASSDYREPMTRRTEALKAMRTLSSRLRWTTS
jgi:hypothetical protein